MNEKLIITSGKKYLDIDAYASILAYRTLLKSLRYDAYACSTATPNESISDLIKDLGFTFDEMQEIDQAKFILLDVSNPEFFDTFVREKDIAKIIDHHSGFEDYWRSRNVDNQIEFIGSVCTIIAEEYFMHHKEDILTLELCKILTAGILDNTLNLKSAITTKRDIEAYNKLLEIGKLPKSWSEEYFSSCYQNVADNIYNWTKDSIKTETTSSLLPPIFGQLIIPKSKDIVCNIETIREVFNSYDEWLLNAICLEEGKSYIIYKSKKLEDNMGLIFGQIEKHQGYLILPHCFLRKEIIKLAKEKEKHKSE